MSDSKPRTHLVIMNVALEHPVFTVSGEGAHPFDILNFEASYAPDDGSGVRKWQESGFKADEHGKFSFQLYREGLSVPGLLNVAVYLDKASASPRVTS